MNYNNWYHNNIQYCTNISDFYWQIEQTGRNYEELKKYSERLQKRTSSKSGNHTTEARSVDTLERLIRYIQAFVCELWLTWKFQKILYNCRNPTSVDCVVSHTTTTSSETATVESVEITSQ